MPTNSKWAPLESTVNLPLFPLQNLSLASLMARADGVGVQPFVMGLIIAMTSGGSILKGLLRAEPLGAMILARLVGGSMLAMMLWEGVLETECL